MNYTMFYKPKTDVNWGKNYILESAENMRRSGDIKHNQHYDNKPVC